MNLRRVAPLAVAALLLGTACAAKMLAEFDLPWHLAFGRQIAATWAIPRVDDFAYTHTAIRYVGVIADLLLYLIVRAAGPLGLQIANGLLAIAIAAALLANAALRTAARDAVANPAEPWAPWPKPLSLGVVAGAMVGLSPWLFMRPATFGFFLVALILLLVERHRVGHRGALIAAVGLVFLWCNMHGSATLGVAILVAYAAYRGACTLGRIRAPVLLAEPGGFTHAAVAAVAAAVLACVNPAGLRIYGGGAEVGAYDDILLEWHRTSPHFFFVDSPSAGTFLVVAILLIVTGGRKMPLFDLVLVLGAAALATRIRFVPIAIVILAPIAASRADRFVRDTAPMRLAFGVAACLVGPAIAVLDEGTLGVGFDPVRFPEPAVRFIADAKPQGNMWNFWPYGGYLIWRLYPEHRVMLDGRIGFVHDRDFVYRAIASETNPSVFREIVADEKIEWAVCRSDERGQWCGPVAGAQDFAMVFVDHMSAIYVRRVGANAALAAKGYRVLTHLTPPSLILEAAVRGTDAEDLSHDALLMRTQDPTSPRVWFVDACAALATRDRPRFDAARARLAVLWPDHPALAMLGDAARSRF